MSGVISRLRCMGSVAVSAAGLMALAGCGSTLDRVFISGSQTEAAPTYALYDGLADVDRELAWTTRQSALEKRVSGKSEHWTNDGTAASGATTPLATWKTDEGVYCRAFEEVVLRAGGAPLSDTRTACRDGDGIWKLAPEQPSSA